MQDGRVLGSTEMGTRMPFICEGDPEALAAKGCEGGDAAAAADTANTTTAAVKAPETERKIIFPASLLEDEKDPKNY